ncbi:Uncharacterised protein [Chryseobacterium carnipullorum]|uniref:Uncharacterized protein n=1 Tax=Chryseobacterium carnipullorum TaxID=1124835 RepID=A0A376DWT4_CHRCU|nr:Uncharacterised protein [Chryseobacterium carnipullorum]
MYAKVLKKLNILGGNTDGVSSDKSFAENWPEHTVQTSFI